MLASSSRRPRPGVFPSRTRPRHRDPAPRGTAAVQLAGACLAAFAISCSVATGTPDPGSLRTPAERSGYATTPTYDETMAYCRALAAASPKIRISTFGTSPQGRDLPLLIVSGDGAFTPEAARATGKPIVLVLNATHAGEVEGKDASLELARDLVTLEARQRLLDHAILLVVPIFSVDAHERRSPWNRMGQNGPEAVGRKATPVGLDLGLDFVKAEAVETRALLSEVFSRWRPHLLVDHHASDGVDHQYDVTFGYARGPMVPRPVERWLREAYEGRVVPAVEAMGHVPGPSVEFRRGKDPMSGLKIDPSPPRFATTYAVLQGRPGVLVETHSLKPYGARVRAAYDMTLALLEELNARPGALMAAVAEAEEEIVARGRTALRARSPADRPEVVLWQQLSDRAAPQRYRGKRMSWEVSDITGARIPRFGAAAWDTVIPFFGEMQPAVTVRQPAGYLVPREWTRVAERLDLHGIAFRRFRTSWTDTVEVQRGTSWSVELAIREGHHPTPVNAVSHERRERSYEPGDIWVPLDQPAGLLAMHLLEAQAPDGLAYWNYFDTVFEQRDYPEDYVMEPIARRMMKEDAALADSFRTRLSADSTFARDARGRLFYFYSRSPWVDPEQNVLPPARALRPPPESVLEQARPQ